MSSVSQHTSADVEGQHLDRWRRLEDDRRFRVEQLAALAAEAAPGGRHASVDQALRSAAVSTLREIDAALARLEQGAYGRCVQCSQPVSSARLDILPMASLCMACHYDLQRRAADTASRT